MGLQGAEEPFLTQCHDIKYSTIECLLCKPLPNCSEEVNFQDHLSLLAAAARICALIKGAERWKNDGKWKILTTTKKELHVTCKNWYTLVIKWVKEIKASNEALKKIE